MSIEKIKPETTQVLMVDIQQKLFAQMSNHQMMLRRSLTLLATAQIFQIPITGVEQYPKGLGETHEMLQPYVQHNFTKTAFSAFGQKDLVAHLDHIRSSSDKPNLLLLGAESHVCLYQTAIDALKANYTVSIAWDATASRYESDRELAKQQLIAAGCNLVSVEMVVFGWLKDAKHEHFKRVSNLLKAH
ncbi:MULTISPECIES: isochorismatase family protein [Aliiglaciecola]|uniref:isochorismatase family protein n=1 Tax=Aliiglaciecola TaxID=1406885 RepID=UPI001C083EDC|nr:MULTISPECIES: isochorismatase family protein [Aliiglaciecola]MBU2880060.1 isochorismatase family protein [Aliiglaciecola lipolytica]MDO6710942.1 isochorismatase family protein [Aliiglaciecola sp. 2_MG-2023]MDO6752423.1 isochorismatase family protein [Aliiglaciecola sp. 1_MG-2023]